MVTGKFHDNPELLKNIGFRKYSSMFKQHGLEKSRPVADLVKQLAAKNQMTPAQVALNWVIHFNGDTIVAIPGATKTRHAEENTGAMKFKLAQDDLQQLDEVSRAFRGW